MNANKKLQKVMATLCLTTIGLSMISGCGSDKNESTMAATKSGETVASETKKAEPTKITFMTNSFEAETIPEDSELFKKLEEYCNVDLTMQFIPSTTYQEKMNITLASGNLPDIMLVPDKTASIIQAAQVGAFWELGDKLKDYPNLSQMLPDVLNNSSIDGKIYGLYRERVYARNGISYRKDWLTNVGMTEVKSLDDFYNMLYKFTYEDPDKNGAQDTYGMAVSKFRGPFDITATWFDAGNGWVVTEEGSLQPTFMTKGYLENLDFWKKMYDNKVINQDFAVLDSAKWTDDLVNSKAGVIVDVLDNAGRLQDKITKADPTKSDNMWAVNTIEGPYGKKNLPTSGYSGMFIFPKQSVKDEGRLAELLTFMDKMLDREANILIQNGIEGKDFTVVNGEMVKSTEERAYTTSGFNQFSTLLTTKDNKPYVNFTTPVRRHVYELTYSEESNFYCVANPVLPLISSTYSTKGAQLDDIIEVARVKYIMGQIDAKGFNDALELWKQQGGNDVINEYTEAYKAAKTK